MSIMNRVADARPLTNPGDQSAGGLAPAEKVRPRLVAGIVFAAWLTAVVIRRGFADVMP